MGFFSKDDNNASQDNVITCAEVMDIAKVSALHEELKESLGRGSAINLDAAAVEKIDAAVLQLFVSFFVTAEMQKVQVKWLQPSDALCRSARLLGLSSTLGLPAGLQV